MKRKGAAPFIKRAERYLKSARLLLKEGDYESCVSRVRFGFEYIESLLMASG
ncbi:MAG: HEPN domain-containing protein, partial [Candidatus Omnitrophica bacterium]|nr:HEPN domain-containing protein [Candidatus Omnitrophota bacterium]